MASSTQRIIITGAPSSGKSTTLARLAVALGQKCQIIPEGALILLAGGFPSPDVNDLEQVWAFQQSILQIQSNMEIILSRQNPYVNLMIFDRGPLDGAGFWPLGAEHFLKEFHINIEEEFSHYDYVLFFELPPAKDYGGKTPLRFHDFQQSLECEKELKKIWGKHPHFIEIKATKEFEDKIQHAINIVKKISNL